MNKLLDLLSKLEGGSLWIPQAQSGWSKVSDLLIHKIREGVEDEDEDANF